MRVNVYAEEMTQRVEIVEKDGHTGLRFYLYLPTTYYTSPEGNARPVSHHHAGGTPVNQLQGPFMHHPGDDDSSAVTFWGKRDMLDVLKKAVGLLEVHYALKAIEHANEPQMAFDSQK